MTRLHAVLFLSVLILPLLTNSRARAQHPAPGSWAVGPAIIVRPGYSYGYPYYYGVHPGVFVGHYQGFYGNGLSMYGPPVKTPGPTPGVYSSGASGRFTPGAVYANPKPRERGWRRLKKN